MKNHQCNEKDQELRLRQWESEVVSVDIPIDTLANLDTAAAKMGTSLVAHRCGST